jgi:hypothetical protein
MPEYEIKRISLYQGGYAGDIGYFFIETNPYGQHIIVTNDARYSIEYPLRWSSWDYGSYSMLFDYIFLSGNRPVTGGSSLGYRCNSTRWLNFKSLLKNILGIKSKSQIFWERFE